MSLEVSIVLLIFILGLLIGSFLNVVIYRVPKGKSIVLPASACQSCARPLKWYHNIPLLSWLMLKGRCSYCNIRIAVQYPLVELLTAILFVLLYFNLGLVWYLPFVWASFSALFALSMIDFKYMAVPDSINGVALVFALIQPNFVDALLYGVLSAAGLYAIGLLSSLLAGRQALGGADIIVAGTMGALLGFPLFFIALFLTALLAFIPALFHRQSGVPFIPFLTLATLIVYLHHDFFVHQLLRYLYA